MAARRDAWTGSWVSKALSEHDHISSVTMLSDNHLQVSRKDYEDCIVGTIAVPKLNGDILRMFLQEEEHNLVFVANVKKGAIITGDAIDLARSKQLALGGLGDLHRALATPSPSTYVDPETQFVARALRQHSRVLNSVQLDDRRYRLERKRLKDVVVLFLNEYELSSEHVRSAIDSYAAFDAIVSKNPSSEPSQAAFTTAEQCGIKLIGTWREFLGELNKPWT